MSVGKGAERDDQYDRGGPDGAGAASADAAAPDATSAVGTSTVSPSFDAPSAVAESQERWGGNISEQVALEFADQQQAYQNAVSTQDADAVRSTMNSLGSTATLAQAMTAAGRPCPAPGFQAHHIVPQSDPRAEEARQLLRDHGISIDAEVNGAWLAGNLETPEPNNMTPHEFTFREDYFEALNAKLSENQEASRSQVEKMLREIREHLEKGDLL